MFEIAAIVAPVFLVVLIGFGASKMRLIMDAEVDTILRFTTHFAVSALLFKATATLDLAEALDPATLASYYLSAFTVFAIGIFLARKLFNQRPGEAVASGFTALFANSVFLGLPIVERAYGEAGLAVGLAIVAVHAPLIYFVGVVTMESTARDGTGPVAALRKVAHTLSHNPLLIAVAAGIAVNLIGFPVPTAALEALELLAKAALPLGMFSIGATLTRYSLAGDLWITSVYVGLALILRPVLVAILAFGVFGIDAVAAKVAVMIAAMPGGINIYIFATLYKRSQALAANALLLGTALSIVSITIWLAVLG